MYSISVMSEFDLGEGVSIFQKLLRFKMYKLLDSYQGNWMMYLKRAQTVILGTQVFCPTHTEALLKRI